jgi:triosephosphate isomerase
MSRQMIAAGNWKMNKSFEDGLSLAREISNAQIPDNVEVILSVPFIHLKAIRDMTLPARNLHISAQNCSNHTSGAYTGEVSSEMLASISIPFVLVGHSERRQYFGEDAAILNGKIEQALSKNIRPIYCCGEPLEIRKAGTHISYVKDQLEATIFKLSEADFSKLVIAYEPIWAIGTGETASKEQAQEMHKAIRDLIAEAYNADVADNVSILYGGSVKPANAKDLFSQPDVDGGLVGGASLKSDDFIEIIKSF